MWTLKGKPFPFPTYSSLTMANNEDFISILGGLRLAPLSTIPTVTWPLLWSWLYTVTTIPPQYMLSLQSIPSHPPRSLVNFQKTFLHLPNTPSSPQSSTFSTPSSLITFLRPYCPHLCSTTSLNTTPSNCSFTPFTTTTSPSLSQLAGMLYTSSTSIGKWLLPWPAKRNLTCTRWTNWQVSNGECHSIGSV